MLTISTQELTLVFFATLPAHRVVTSTLVVLVQATLSLSALLVSVTQLQMFLSPTHQVSISVSPVVRCSVTVLTAQLSLSSALNVSMVPISMARHVLLVHLSVILATRWVA